MLVMMHNKNEKCKLKADAVLIVCVKAVHLG